MELEHIRKIYDLQHPYLQCFGIDVDHVTSILNNLAQFANAKTINGPDLWSKCDASLIGIEYFEYSSSRKGRKESAEQRELERANRDFLKRHTKKYLKDTIFPKNTI